MAVKKKQTFEEQLSAAEQLIARLEEGGMSLEETVSGYETGMKLLAELEKQLAEAEQRLTVIRKAADGTIG